MRGGVCPGESNSEELGEYVPIEPDVLLLMLKNADGATKGLSSSKSDSLYALGFGLFFFAIVNGVTGKLSLTVKTSSSSVGI